MHNADEKSSWKKIQEKPHFQGLKKACI